MRLRIILTSCAFALALPFAAHAAAPLEAYTKLPALEQPDISPAGDRLAYIVVVGEARHLGVQTLTGQALGNVPLGDQKVRFIQWVDDDHLLIAVEKYFSGDHGAGLTMIAYNIPQKKFVSLLDHKEAITPAIAGAARIRYVDGKPVVYVEGFDTWGHYTTFLVDLDTGHGYPSPDAAGVLDGNAKAIYREEYSKDDGHWRLTYKDGVGWKEIWNRGGYKIETPSLLGTGRRSGTAIISVPEERGDELYEVANDGTATRLKFGAKIGEVGTIRRPYTGDLVGFRFQTDDDEEYVFTDPAADKAWLAVLAGFPGEHVVLSSSTPDFSKVVVHAEGHGDSGSFYLIDNTTHKAVKLGGDYPSVTSADLADVQFIHYTAADGTIIPAYLTLPKGRDPKNLPLIVLPHGGPQARDEPGFDWFSQSIASRGYAVLQPEFRGSTGFGKAHFEAGFGQWGRKMQTDLSDGVRYLAAQGTIDPKRVCIFGWSYGGYAALAGPTLDPGVYRCAVAGAPVSDLNAMLSWEKSQGGERHDTLGLRFWNRFMGGNGSGDPKLQEVSPTRHADRVNVPILLIHGKDDVTVPYEQSELMVDALKRAGKPVELVTLTGEDHYLSKGKTRQEAFTAVVNFLEKNNPPS